MKKLNLIYTTLIVLAFIISSNIAYGVIVKVAGDCTACEESIEGSFILLTVTCTGTSGTCITFNTSGGAADLSNCPCPAIFNPHGNLLPSTAKPKRIPFVSAPTIVDILDIDGNVIGATVTAEIEIRGFREVAISPNPVRNKEVNFRFRSDIAQNVLVEVLDIDLGQTVQKQISATAGMNHDKVALPNTFAGPCIFSLITNTNTLSESILVQ